MGANELDCVVTDLCRQIREGKDEITRLREENARLRGALKDADNALRMCVFEVGLNEEADGFATAHSFSRSVLDRIASGDGG